MSRVHASRILATAALVFGLGLGCKAKPSEEACRDAIANVRRIAGQGTSDVGADPVAAIRSCRGNSSKKTVECMRNAKTIEDLDACEGEVGQKYFDKAAEERGKRETEAAESDAGKDTEEKAGETPPAPTPDPAAPAPEATKPPAETPSGAGAPTEPPTAAAPAHGEAAPSDVAPAKAAAPPTEAAPQ